MTYSTNNLIPVDALGFFERLNYFFGKLLTVRDFQTEQSYFNEKRWMLNRQAMGCGVVCGMEVSAKNSAQDPLQVMVDRGLALDQYGNEIFIGAAQTVDLPQAQPPSADRAEYFICVRYKEQYTEPVPAPSFRCEAEGPECHYSRRRELFELQAFRPSEKPPEIAPAPKFGLAELVADSCSGVPPLRINGCSWPRSLFLTKRLFKLIIVARESGYGATRFWVTV
jgi:hypothetical protein